MSLGTVVGLGPDDIVLDGGPAPTPQFFAHVHCGQTSGWMKTPLGTVWPRPHCIRLDPSCRERGTAAPPPSFRAMSVVVTVAHLSYC